MSTISSQQASTTSSASTARPPHPVVVGVLIFLFLAIGLPYSTWRTAHDLWLEVRGRNVPATIIAQHVVKPRTYRKGMWRYVVRYVYYIDGRTIEGGGDVTRDEYERNPTGNKIVVRTSAIGPWRTDRPMNVDRAYFLYVALRVGLCFFSWWMLLIVLKMTGEQVRRRAEWEASGH